ncbi:MAG: hypothetical protein ACFE0J_12345 [Elainellaceae cyanobacterium]
MRSHRLLGLLMFTVLLLLNVPLRIIGLVGELRAVAQDVGKGDRPCPL